MDDFKNIFDKAFKRIITLSSPAVIRMINSLFDCNHPLDSTVSYNWTEFIKDDMKGMLADTIITINESDRYHIEVQMTNDKTIIFRMLDYGFQNAKRVWEHLSNADYSNVILDFPKQLIIYLYHESPIPDELSVTIRFENNNEISYRIKTVDFLNESIEDINNKGMILLIPFALLKLRKAFEKARTRENIDALKTLFWDDIIGSINKNLQLGNITDVDAHILIGICVKLFDHIYSCYKESEEVLPVRDHSLVLDIDPYIDKMEAAIAKTKEAEERTKELEEQTKELEEQTKEAEERTKEAEVKMRETEEKLNKVISEKDAEIAALKAQLEKQSKS